MQLKKKLSQIVVLSVLLMSFFPAITMAALFSIDIDGLPEPESGIQSFSIWLSIDNQFSFTDFTFGNAVPQSQLGQMIGWDAQTNIATDSTRGLVFKVGGLDRDGAYLTTNFDLTNGVIATFNYSGSILGVTDIFQFSNAAGANQVEALKLVYELSDTALHISNVPIPPALLLFGSGLIGLVGLRRKIKN